MNLEHMILSSFSMINYGFCSLSQFTMLYLYLQVIWRVTWPSTRLVLFCGMIFMMTITSQRYTMSSRLACWLQYKERETFFAMQLLVFGINKPHSFIKQFLTKRHHSFNAIHIFLSVQLISSLLQIIVRDVSRITKLSCAGRINVMSD